LPVSPQNARARTATADPQSNKYAYLAMNLTTVM
jgi:hypothetical protein